MGYTVTWTCDTGSDKSSTGEDASHGKRLCIETDAGVTGWGEGFGHRIWPATRAAIDTLIGPMCVGRDATAINALIDDLQRNLHGIGRTGPAMYALSAIDIALWDIAGKVAG